MRNRHRPPDQQDALISSSDSEGEEKKKNESAEKARVKAELENGNVDDMWAEVEEKNEDKEGTGSSSSEDNISLGSHADDIAETISSYRINRLPGRPKILEEHQLPENIEKVNNKLKEAPNDCPEPTNKDERLNKYFESPKDLDKPKTGFESLTETPEASATKFNELMVELEKIHKEAETAVPDTTDQNEDEEIDYTKLRKMEDEEKKANDEGAELPELIADQDSGSEVDNDQELFKSCRALGDIANNIYQEETSEDILKKSVDSMYDHYGSKIFAEHTESLNQLLGAENPSFELDPKVCCDRPQTTELVEQEEGWKVFPKTKEEQDYEEECDEANDRVEYNMDELSSQLAEDLEELKEPLRKLREELDPLTIEGDDEEQKDKCLDMSTVVRSVRLTEEFNMLRERISEGMIKQKEEEDKKRLTIEEIGSKNQVETKTGDDIDAEDYAFAKALDICTENVPTRVYGAGCDVPSYKWEKEECLRQLRVKDVYNEIPDDEYQPLSLHTSAEEADAVCKRLTEKMAQEDASLRDLLQDLENEANELYDIESPVEEEKAGDLAKDPEQTIQMEEDRTKEVKNVEPDADIKEDKTDLGIEIDRNPIEGPDPADVCIALLDELVDELQYKEIISGHDIKCYDFGLIESDEEYTYSAEPNVERIVPAELENPAGGKSIRECVESFGDFIVAVKERRLQKKVEKRESSNSDKIRAAQELLKSKTPFDFSRSELDEQIAKQKERAKRRVAAMAARCFEKRELYEDSLDVVDNRLMVVKKGTGALEELPPPPPLVTDSESELDSNGGESSGADAYDTAEEAHEAAMDALSRPYTSRSLWAKPGQPLAAVQPSDATPFIEQEQSPSLLDQALEEFYSLEAGTAFNSLDSEFMDKLDLQKVIGTDGEITDEGMRTYNEFQAQQKSELEKKEQASEVFKEDEMLKGLIERKRIHDERERQVKELDNLEDLTKFKINTELSEQELPQGFNDNPEEIKDVTQNNYKDFTEQSKDLPLDEVSSDWNEIEWESDKEGFELREVRDPDEIGSIKLTIGTCKLYEIKSQLPEILEDIEEEDAEEVKITEEGNKEDEPKSNESIVKTTSVLTSAVQRNLNASIDDDILSDASTDYESSEDIPVIEPPKLPQGALNDFFCNEFEDRLKHDLECEEALRKELFNLHPGSWIAQVEEKTKEKIEITEIIDSNMEEKLENENNAESGAGDFKDSNTQSTAEDDINEVDGAIGELAVSAKEQWAKISKRLNDFINADEVKLLDEHEFKEESDNDDQLLVQDLESLGQLNPICEPECQLENLECNLEDNKNKKAEEPNEDQADIHDVVDVGEQPCSKKTNPPSTITLDYFDAEEPVDDVDFDEAGQLKTEEIECNLEILNDDGEAVKNVSVNAQVTYEFK